MAEYSITTDYGPLGTPWVLKDDTLKNLAIGKLASIGSAQATELNKQVAVLQDLVVSLDAGRNDLAKYTPPQIDLLTYESGGPLSVGSWDIGDLIPVPVFQPNGIFPWASTDPKVDRLINFFSHYNQQFLPTQPLSANAFRVSFQRAPGSQVESAILESPQYVIEMGTNKRYVVISENGTSSQYALVDVEPFALPGSVSQYQEWLQEGAKYRSSQIATIIQKYKITTVAPDSVRYEVNLSLAEPGRIGTRFYGAPPVLTNNVYTETAVGKIVTYILPADGKSYISRILTPFYVTADQKPVYATWENLTAITPVDKPMYIAVSDTSFREISSTISDKITQITQRNTTQQLFVNKLLVSQNYHFDAATNVLKAFSDLLNKLAGAV